MEEELRRLQSEGILSKTEWSEWAPKQDGPVRICGDFKGIINSVLQAEQYPLPRIEDIFAHLAGGEKFSKFDLQQAYHQIEMKEESKKYLTINTSTWQRSIDRVLEGTSGTSCILDDVIVMEEVHHHGLRAKKAKCMFFKEKTTFCGHGIDRQGLHKTMQQTRQPQ